MTDANVSDLPKAAIVRIAKKNGIERIGKDAVDTLLAKTEEFVAKVAKDANVFASHANRTTVGVDDINLAVGAPKAVKA